MQIDYTEITNRAQVAMLLAQAAKVVRPESELAARNIVKELELLYTTSAVLSLVKGEESV